jgi:hypothetical protein
MGRELFDFAFREYAQRWKFKRPTPADFFRTMEDASAIDLDWFWRGWFYSTDHVDVALTDLREYRVSTANPDVESELSRKEHAAEVPETLKRAVAEEDYIYFMDFENIGGLPTPLPLRITNADGSEEMITLPAEIWRRDPDKITRLLIRDKAIIAVALDPRHETADADFSNNHFPSRIEKSRIELYKSDVEKRDLMADMLHTLRARKTGEDDSVRTIPLKSTR